MRIFVRDNNVDQALRFLKKKMQREGLFREIKAHAAYEKPSEKRVREKAESIRRAKKLARKKAQREGLIPMPKPKPRAPARPNPFAATSPGATPRPLGQSEGFDTRKPALAS
ncbi:30S ribosomal protein S21 [Aestuariivirga sp.]|uniref:30S ribosomal protein S21 n=1 Tax=Aestuariivirga sp. TaxID=2650926 RepID=UPI0035934B19